jgi:hypothetical protein
MTVVAVFERIQKIPPHRAAWFITNGSNKQPTQASDKTTKGEALGSEPKN